MEKESKASTLKSDQKVIVLRSVAQYLERCGFSKCFKKLLSEAEIEKKELDSSLPDLDEVFCQFFHKSYVEAVEVKESGDDNEDGKKKAASVDENGSDDHEKDEKAKKEKKKKKKKEPERRTEREKEEEENKTKSKSRPSEADEDDKEKSSKKRKRSEPEETKEQTEEEDDEESKRRKKDESVVDETPVKKQAADVQENGNVEKSEKKSGKGLSNSKVPKKPFQRVNVEEIVFTDERLKDNSYWAKDGADSGYGAKAQEVLGQVRGRGFRHEKTKKKRGSYRGGEIDVRSHSVKFEYSDDE
ncbi:PREDICTED: nucleolar and coiled-body phosphoprotein 1 [Brassica oleracea var. oleracea]|uniref:nucleolar and coiled-body phosphoprotein 1 n=1 Tax=Brassica oleracea var. oleracea TaxID=109376 RepID=UPI0006A73275|nr:PREDICTED: nucleolar and coiled-body phosphoprotein 1 [Brassica oleracea var. oleracea]